MANNKCTECGRDLVEGETELCPNCKRTKHSTWKMIGSVAVLVIAVVAVIVTGKKPNLEA